jgi:hypothetical protein
VASLEDAIKRRGVAYLVHFTRVENIESIMRMGLVPVESLLHCGIKHIHNDKRRIDNYPNANCFSIMHCNYKLLYFYCSGVEYNKYAVMYYDANLLLHHKVGFFPTNAARCRAKHVYSNGKSEAFERMFMELDPAMGTTRAELGLKDYFPTDPQSEALVFGQVSNSFLRGVFFYDKESMERYERYIPGSIDVFYSKNAFRERHDWEFWRHRSVDPRYVLRMSQL